MMYVAVLCMCAVLCGCTRREQLVLEAAGGAVSQDSERAAEDSENLAKAADEQDPQGQPASDVQVLQGQPASGGLEPSVQSGVEGQMPQNGNGAALPGERQTICVHVCGAVNHPDVYELASGSRVYEAVKKAGGFSEDADESYVNQAQVLSDGVKLVIPTLQETAAFTSDEEEMPGIGIIKGSSAGQQDASSQTQDVDAATGQDASDGRININTATEAELCNIPGIGAARAAAIIAYRQEKGGFSKIEDIMGVSGIKEGTYAKIKDSIKVN